MRALAAFFILLVAVSYSSAKTQSDTDIAAALVGTWIDAASEQEPMHTKATYFKDGRGVELVWPAGQPESTAVRIETRWAVTNSVLVIRSVKSSDTSKVPVGIELRDRIVSMSSDQLVFEPEAGYGDIEKKRHTRLKVKDGHNESNNRAALDAGRALWLHIGSPWPGASEKL